MGAVVGRRTTVAALAVLAAIILVGSGCDATTDGSAASVTTTDEAGVAEALWDPCTQIGDQLLRQVGVDPSTQDNTISGVENVKGWKLCSWKDKAVRENYALGVWTTTHTIEESKEDVNNVDFSDITIAGRWGVQFRRASDTHNEKCYLSFPAIGQSIEISVYKSVLTEDERNPCDIASSAAEILVPEFPQ